MPSRKSFNAHKKATGLLPFLDGFLPPIGTYFLIIAKSSRKQASPPIPKPPPVPFCTRRFHVPLPQICSRHNSPAASLLLPPAGSSRHLSLKKPAQTCFSRRPFSSRRNTPPAGGFCGIGNVISTHKKVCAWRTLAPERGCVSSHIPLRRVRLPPEAFVS